MNPVRAAISFFRMRASWLGDGGQPVPLAQAQARADTCLSCPLNQAMPLWETLTAPAAKELRQQIQLKATMQLAVQGEDGLRICGSGKAESGRKLSGCGCVLPLKVWVPIAHIKETTPLNELHERCWITRELATLP